MVFVGGDLALATEGFERIALPDGGVALNVGSDFEDSTKKPPLTQRPSPLGFSEKEVTCGVVAISSAPNFPTDWVAVSVTSVLRLRWNCSSSSRLMSARPSP